MTWRHDDGWTTSLKCKPDCVIVGESVVLDLKTTQDASPSKWQWSALDYGYHRQAAIYLDTLEAMYGKPFRFLFGVVSKNEPYEVAVYKLSEEDLDRGRDEYHALIAEYRRRTEENDWLAEWQVGEYELALPFRRR
jgi:exodeoxyribonuclease VIII